jgi:TonB-like protein
MRTLIRWVGRLYPATWRNRYAAEFDALLEDISPRLRDLCNVLGHVLRARATTAIDACLVLAPVHPMTLRMPVVISLSTHALIATLVLWAVLGNVTPLHLPVLVAPLPPPAPDPPPQVTDARVFPNASTLYSSLPLGTAARGDAVSLYVAEGVGINFLSLPDIGAVYRKGNAEWRVWPGQALESLIVRRVLPEYPRGTNERGAVSVFIEYLITRDGSVKVLRISGTPPFTSAAQSAIEQWVYRPLEYENHPCEVASRVEVRFDREFAESQTSR